MRIEQLDPSTLIPYELNNRTHDQKQVDRIANSIASFGFNQPIVVDEQNIVLAGHGRLAAALKLGLRQVPIVRATELTEAQKKAYRILDNKLQNDSTWEYNNLALELDFLKEADFDISAFGLEALDITSGDAEEKPLPTLGEETVPPRKTNIHYDIVFDNEDQQERWYAWLKHTKELFPSLNTVSARLTAFIDETLPR